MSEPPVDLVRRAMQAASAETAEYESSIAEVSALDHERVLVMISRAEALAALDAQS